MAEPTIIRPAIRVADLEFAIEMVEVAHLVYCSARTCHCDEVAERLTRGLNVCTGRLVVEDGKEVLRTRVLVDTAEGLDPRPED